MPCIRVTVLRSNHSLPTATIHWHTALKAEKVAKVLQASDTYTHEKHEDAQPWTQLACKMGSPLKIASPQQSVRQHDDASQFEYPNIQELDPSVADGYQIFYDRDVPVELRSASTVDIPTEVGALEAIRVRILVKGGPQQLDAVRVELSSEANLFFHYTHQMDPAAFQEVQDSQRLMVDFGEYPAVLLRMLNAAIREPHLHLAVMILQPTGEARLDFIQNMEYKFVELLSCRFCASSEETVRAQVSYRYNVLRARCNLLQSRLVDINSMVKTKNPSLLLQFQRTAPYKAGSPVSGGVMGSPVQGNAMSGNVAGGIKAFRP